jgi:hypothetical protein
MLTLIALKQREHVLVETYDRLIASENNELKRENQMLKMELSRLKSKGHV